MCLFVSVLWLLSALDFKLRNVEFEIRSESESASESMSESEGMSDSELN